MRVKGADKYKVTRWLDDNKHVATEHTAPELVELVNQSTGVKTTPAIIRGILSNLGINCKRLAAKVQDDRVAALEDRVKVLEDLVDSLCKAAPL